MFSRRPALMPSVKQSIELYPYNFSLLEIFCKDKQLFPDTNKIIIIIEKDFE